ncbi:MAG: 50S ribosomal protein L10 [Clostridia bacterium]|nr:50S ribosomal protein L10 [Clostridia bacterium]
MANATILSQKQQVVAELVEKIKGANSGVLVDYKGISVANDTKLRADLRKENVHYSVVKNTLCARAFDEVGFHGLKDVLNGNTALALSTDQVAAAKVLQNYAKDNEHFVIKAGFVDGRILTAEEVKALAEIPSKEVLIARILGSLQSSLYGFAYAIQAIIDKKNEESGAPAEAAEEPAAEPAAEAAPEAAAEATAEAAPEGAAE